MIPAKQARRFTDNAATMDGILLQIEEDIRFESLQGNSESSLAFENWSHLTIGAVMYTLTSNGYRVWLTDNSEHREVSMRKGRRVPKVISVLHYAW